MAEKVNLEQQSARFQEHWSPKIVAGLNERGTANTGDADAPGTAGEPLT